MSKATVYASAQFGLATEVTATGLVLGSTTWEGSSETAELPDHIGCAAGLAVWNMKKEVSGDGIIATKGTGLVGNIGSVLTLANAALNARSRNSEGLGVTADANAALVITGNTITPAQTGFEAGGFSGIYLPYVATNAPVTLS